LGRSESQLILLWVGHVVLPEVY